MDPIPTPVPLSQRDPQNQVDPCTVTGAYHVVKGRYGKRAGDKPLWWVFAYHFVKAFAALLPYAITAWLLKTFFGFDFHGGTK